MFLLSERNMKPWLVVWLPSIFYFPINIGEFLIIPIDELHHFSEGWLKTPPTSSPWYWASEHRFLYGTPPFENGSKKKQETWMIEETTIILPSFCPKCSKHHHNFWMVLQIVNRSGTKPRSRFRGFICHGRSTGNAPILGESSNHFHRNSYTYYVNDHSSFITIWFIRKFVVIYMYIYSYIYHCIPIPYIPNEYPLSILFLVQSWFPYCGFYLLTVR